MSDEVLETFVQKYIASQPTPEVQFAWQGGEPTLMGLDYFRRVVALQKKHTDGRPIRNTIQTNGTLLDDRWCEFLAQEKFLVGLSLDGPEPIHNRYRKNKQGGGSFDQVMAGLELLKKWKVEFNVLTCVGRESPDEAVEIYAFLKKQGVRFMQFIPIIEREEERGGLKLADPPNLSSPNNSTAMMPWAVSSDGYGQFLCRIFDRWIEDDVGRIFVNMFDVALGAWCGIEASLCIYARRCGNALAIEHDGGVYACDHYVYPDYHLGNIMEKSLEEMVLSPEQVEFGADKWNALPIDCRECEFLFACNGGCPKHRFLQTPSGEPGLNYSCASYKKFFGHIDTKMRAMATLVQSGRPAADIMKKDRSSNSEPTIGRRLGRNKFCPCGSGKKFKKCCSIRRR